MRNLVTVHVACSQCTLCVMESPPLRTTHEMRVMRRIVNCIRAM